ncbi:MAG: glycosyl hydrolase 115 family protein [Ginsengibacter sp.]
MFELLLRLKANLIRPGMHPSTKTFCYYPGNKKAAADYCIVVGFTKEMMALYLSTANDKH